MNDGTRRSIRLELVALEGVCWYCGVDLRAGERQATVDHFIALARGGADVRLNLILACVRCNRRKADRAAEELVCHRRRGEGLLRIVEQQRLSSRSRVDRDSVRIALEEESTMSVLSQETVTFDELDALYRACESAEWPNCEVPAPDWWRCLIVLTYNCGLRRAELLGLRTADVDFERRRLRFPAQKTRRTQVLPINDTVIAHVQRVWSTGRGLLLPGVQSPAAFAAAFRRLNDAAGLSPPVPFQALRPGRAGPIGRGPAAATGRVPAAHMKRGLPRAAGGTRNNSAGRPLLKLPADPTRPGI